MKTNQSVYIIDSFSHHSFHEVFTASFINISNFIFKNIFYYSCKSTKECVENILKNVKNIEASKIRYRNIFVVENENKYFLVLRYFVATLVNVFYLIKVPKDSLIVYCYNNIFATPILNVFNKVLNKRVVIFCHGELRLVDSDLTENLGPVTKLIRKGIISFFLNKDIKIASKLIFIVLGDGILFNLKNILPPNVMHSIYAIDDPIIFDGFKKPYKQRHKLSLGVVGVVSKEKNIDQFIYLAKIFLPEIKNKKISFSVTGAIYYKKKELVGAYIDIPDGHNGLISRSEFNKRIQNLDYILFFYHSKMYKYLTSGAVFDAVNAEIPIIALRNDYFEYLFSRFGPFGYLVDSIDDMENLIRKILTGKKMGLFNFKNIKENLSPLAVSCQFESILKRTGFYNLECEQ
jgi:hypothetical protein